MLKTQLGSFERFYNSGAVNTKKDGSIHEVKLFLKMLGLSFTPKLA